MNRYLITGTTSGIGQAIRRHIEGDIFELNRTQADLNNPDEVMALDIPTVDYAILNAGHDTGGGVNFLEHNPRHMFDIINCNLTSNMLLAQKILNKNKVLAPKLYQENYKDNYIEVEDFGNKTIFQILKKNYQRL